MVAKSVQLKQVLWAYILFCWVSIVYASEMSFSEGIESIPFKAIGYVAVLSVLGGMASTLPKIINPAVTIQNLPLEILKDVVCSCFAGVVIFFIALWLSWAWSLTCLFILLGGAGNAKFIDMALNNGFFPRMAQVFGKMPDSTMPPKDPTAGA